MYEDDFGKVTVVEVKNKYGNLTLNRHYNDGRCLVLHQMYKDEQDLLKNEFRPTKETKVLRILKEYESKRQGKIRDRR